MAPKESAVSLNFTDGEGELPGISVLIPAYNEEKYLPDTISSIRDACHKFSNDFHLPTELIVVDNDSTDQTSAIAAASGARVVKHAIRNIASVRNAGIKSASYSTVITLDADSYMPNDALTEIWSSMSGNKYIGGGVRLGIRSRSILLRLLITLVEPLIVFLTGLSGGMFFFRRKTAIEIGGFPEEALVAEDMVFARKLRAHGKTVGKSFLNLRSVKILTLDRKNASFLQSLKALYIGFRAFTGKKFSREDLEYWYNPKR